MANCAYCHAAISTKQSLVDCPVCQTTYHAGCWQEAGSKCSNLGCTGSGALTAYAYAGDATPAPLPTPHPAARPVPRRRSPRPWLIWVGIASGVLVWFGLAYFVLRITSTSVPFIMNQPAPGWLTPALVALVAGGSGFGVYRGIHSGTVEIRRLLYVAAGFLVFYIVAEFAVRAYLFGRSAILPVPESELIFVVAGLGGIVAGAWPAAGRGLLPTALSAVVGLYLADIIRTLWPYANAWTSEIQLLVLGVLAAAAFVPLILPAPMQGLVGAASAALPGFALSRLWQPILATVDLSGPARLALVLALISLPLGGFLLARRLSEGQQGVSLAGLGHLVVAGLVAAAWMVVLVALATLLVPPLRAGFAFVAETAGQALPPIVALPLLRGYAPVLVLFALVTNLYALLAALARLSPDSVFGKLAGLGRWLSLTIISAMVGLFFGALTWNIFRDWPLFQQYADVLPWTQIGLPALGAFLGALYGLIYNSEKGPFVLIVLGFALWLTQMLLLAAALAFVGGLLGSWIAGWIPASVPTGLPGHSWRFILTAALLHVGLLAPIARALILWSGGKLGLLVDQYRLLAARAWARPEVWLDTLLNLASPVWLTAAFGGLAILSGWLYVRLVAAIA